jgi:hypothetical protein
VVSLLPGILPMIGACAFCFWKLETESAAALGQPKQWVKSFRWGVVLLIGETFLLFVWESMLTSIRHQPHFWAELHRHGLEKCLKLSAGTTSTDYNLYKASDKHVERIDDVAQYNKRCSDIAEMFFSMDNMTPRELMPYPHEPTRPQPWQKYDHLSLHDRLEQLDLPQYDKDLFVCHTNSFGSATAPEIAWTDALRWYALGGYSISTMYDAVACYKLGKGGMTNFARHIFAEYRGDVLFNKVVTSIEQHPVTGVKITCNDGASFEAGWAVCTIPLNCLQDINFSPPLNPSKQAATKEGHINKGEKYLFRVEHHQENWFANTSDSKTSDFQFGWKDHDGMSSKT